MRHPSGLYLLFFTEMWERFSYYGMRALFCLFLTKAMLYSSTDASNIYGSFTGLVYLTPLLGGYISDRYWGNRRSVAVGGILMALGHFLLFLSASYLQSVYNQPLFLAGLFFLCMGNGFFKPNISTMVGQLYPKNDPRVDSAYTIFYMGINVGALFSPLICGTFGDTEDPSDFRWGFLAACLGMILGVMVFGFLHRKYLLTPEGEPIGVAPKKRTLDSNVAVDANKSSMKQSILCLLGFLAVSSLLYFYYGCDVVASLIYSASVVVPVYVITDRSLTAVERRRIWVVYIIAFFVIFYWAAYEQAGASITFFVESSVDRVVLDWTIPTSYFQSINPFYIVCLAPLISLLWNRLDSRGVKFGVCQKQALGILILSVSYAILAFATYDSASGASVGVSWVLLFYLVYTVSELCLSPIGLSMVTKLSPTRLVSLLMGVWFLSTSSAQKLSGTLSSLYPEKLQDGSFRETDFLFYHISNLPDFFFLFVVLTVIPAVILFILSKKLDKMMEE